MKVSAEENLGLVHLCANRFRNRGIEYEELYSAGCVGLLKAIKVFDDTRGVKFSTYAVPVILGEIKRLFRDGGTVRVSRSLKELYMKVNREKEAYVSTYGKEPTITELSKILQVDEYSISLAMSSSLPPVSLTETDEDGGGQLDIPTASPDTEIGNTIALNQILDSLDEKDRNMIILRYYRNMTQSQTAEILGMTQVQVSRREKKILAHMREELS
ncbi:MAG: sigma-70 family RNA polymerase sigma factor [Ruminococcus sp.]|nr:sigma-70 family RNA polymerase sigma factor [Ruminococcus sp.]MCD7801088.1 sigma-70 family RNA polymerase sigma factor [Ruminococcus sp.]